MIMRELLAHSLTEKRHGFKSLVCNSEQSIP